MHAKPAVDELFERRLTFPDFEPQERLARLVGLDDHKDRLSKILGLLVNRRDRTADTLLRRSCAQIGASRLR